MIGSDGNKKSANRVMATGMALMAGLEIHRFPAIESRKAEKNSLKYFEQHGKRQEYYVPRVHW